MKENEIDFGKPLRAERYKFIVNLGENKTAKFKTKNNNLMVLKTKQYFENTVQKIGL